MTKVNVATNEMPFGVDFSHFIYLLFGIFGTIFVLSFMAAIKYFGWGVWSFFALPILFIWVINYGLFKGRYWVIWLILVNATFSLIGSLLLSIIISPTSKAALIFKIILSLFAIFYGSQIIIFSRKRTRQYFHGKSTLLKA